MCELGVFPIFLENDPLKVDKILGLTSFKARKVFEGFKTEFFHLLKKKGRQQITLGKRLR